MEGVEFDTANYYADVIKIYLQCLFFIPILPYTPFFGAAALLVSFWTTKYTLLRRSKRPIQISHKILELPIHFLRVGGIVLGVTIP